MAINAENIEIGEGNLTIKHGAEVAGTDVGACKDAELNVEIEEKEVETGQYIDPINSFDIKRVISFKITLIEDTMRNFILAIGGDPADVVDADGDLKYTFPGNSVTPSKYANLLYEVPRITDKTEVKSVELYKVKVSGGVTIMFKKTEEKVYTTTFRAFADPDNAGSPGIVTYGGLGTPP